MSIIYTWCVRDRASTVSSIQITCNVNTVYYIKGGESNSAGYHDRRFINNSWVSHNPRRHKRQ